MAMKRYVRAFSLTGAALLVLAVNSTAAGISYNTLATTRFGGASLTLDSSSGDHAATLTFLTLADTMITVPSKINYGFFTVTCDSCTPVSVSVFDPFTFDTVITDAGSGATGTFVGTSAGGQILSNSSTLSIGWEPGQIGPSTLHATLGDFGFTPYTYEVTTDIVAPNSGLTPGVTTVHGFVDSAVPEPATMALIGLGLLGLGFIHRRRTAQR